MATKPKAKPAKPKPHQLTGWLKWAEKSGNDLLLVLEVGGSNPQGEWEIHVCLDESHELEPLENAIASIRAELEKDEAEDDEPAKPSKKQKAVAK